MIIDGGRIGPKSAVRGSFGVAATQHPIVTQTIVRNLAEGGNAIDAAIAGALVQATVQQEMTNHTGSVLVLYWDNKQKKLYELNSTGTIVPDIAPLRPVPTGRGGLMSFPKQLMAVIPGFMPAMKALHEKFATKSWESLCAPAITWAEEGHVVNSLEFRVLANEVDFYTYTDSGREHFLPGGHLPEVGMRWQKPVLAKTLRRLARNGPDDFIDGDWARAFVARANAMGWPITLKHMSAIPPRWGEGMTYKHAGTDIVQLSPPERQAVFSSIGLGIMAAMDLKSYGHYSEDPEAAYLISHALRRATIDVGMLHDPEVFGDPTSVLMDPSYHAHLANLIKTSMPKKDMTRHVELMRGKSALAVIGGFGEEPPGSCESTIVDKDGNWVQMMNTLQGGGIPGEVVEGVPMLGSHATSTLRSDMCGWLTGGGRSRHVIGSTFLMRDGQPQLSLGSPANGCRTIPLVISNMLDFGMDPATAESHIRFMPMADEYQIAMEARVTPDYAARLASLGVSIQPLEPYDWHMGSFQMAWREDDSVMSAIAGYRRSGDAAAVETTDLRVDA